MKDELDQPDVIDEIDQIDAPTQKEGEMTISERIQERLRGLPEPTQREVLDFVEYLAHKLRKEDDEWSRLSVTAALRGLEEETWPQYNEADFKEKWQ